MSILRAPKRVLSKGLSSYSAGVRTEKHGFPIEIDTPHEPWKKVLEEYMPIFDEVGWLDEMSLMKIKDGCVAGNNIGNYINGTINMEHNPEKYTGLQAIIIELSQRAVLTHEIVHHAHIRIHGYRPETLSLTKKETKLLRKHVSKYSTTNRLEAVAEIGTGIALGYDFPDEIHEIYEKYDGPKEAYEIRRMRE